MKYLLLIIVFVNSIVFAQSLEIKGNVVDSDTQIKLSGVNISVSNSQKGTATNDMGEFSFIGDFNRDQKLIFTYLGYKTFSLSIDEFLNSDKVIRLAKTVVDFDNTVIVEGLIAKEGETPASFAKITRKEIEKDFTVQDVPEYLSYLPSTTFYSENGNGIGYNYLSIRGFGQRRISISYNGIPQNDPEDHNVYWHNISDILESTELVQVQRGAGAGITGYPSIGGAINIVTSPFSDEPKLELSSTYGSYNTRKFSAKFASGLIDDKYSVYAKLSKTLSDGYRDNSWVDFNSYHVSAARYDENLTTVINFYGGPNTDGLVWTGLPKEYIKDKDLRKTSFNSKYDVESFSQPHYELLNELKINNKLTLNSALFFVIGEGYFDFDGWWSIYYDDYFRLKENNYTTDELPQNAIIRAQVDNKQWGWLPKLTWEHDNGTLIVGAEYRHHRSLHWGAIRFAENIPANVPQNYKYYSYRGGNDIVNFFVNENFKLSEKLNILGELQLAYHNYQIYDEKYVGTDFSLADLFLNPRLGFNYKFNNKINAYVSYARVTREPRLKNYYDAAESSGGAIPQFEQNNGVYNFDEPLVKPEVMNDIELGARYSNDKFTLNANLFYMMFNDEIISSGQLDRFGQPITGNVDETTHMGIEISGRSKITKNIEAIVNASYSRNTISSGNTFLEDENGDVQTVDLTENQIGGFPELTMNFVLRGNYEGFAGQLSGKYVGDYFSDNFDDNIDRLLAEQQIDIGYDNTVDSYFVLNFLGSYEFKINSVFNKVRVFAQVNNIFDNLYAAYATGEDFFPAAERNFLVGLKLGL